LNFHENSTFYGDKTIVIPKIITAAAGFFSAFSVLGQNNAACFRIVYR